MTDTPHATLAEALYELQQEVGALPRDAVNPFYHSNFSSFPAIKEKVDPIAWKHGLFVKQALNFDGENDLLTNILFFNGEAAEAYNVRMHLPSGVPQAHGSATTFYRRYAYTTCLGLVSEADDDGNAASTPSVPPRATVTRPAPTLTHTVSTDEEGDFS